jgi:NADH dehydrogenase FAD-containing subunit/cytochrome bd-type quinol oxidase subunit 2
MDLQLVWFVLIAVLWAGYFVLEGFDFGVGMLLPFLPRGERQRAVMLESIGPVWDGNEVWLVVAGGATFAAFPAWYATMFSGFYVALVLVLVFLIVRVVSFEWRERSDGRRWRRTWTWANTIGSAGAALVWGVGLANLLQGVPIDSQGDFAGSVVDLFSPYTVIAGVAVVLLFAFHGATFLTLRTSGDLCRRAALGARRLSIPAVVVAGAFLGWTVAVAVDDNDKGVFPTVAPAVVGIAALVGAAVSVRARRSGRAFALTALGTIALVATLFTGLYPRVMVSSTDFANSLTVQGASSSHYALRVMTVVALILTPIVLLYQGWTYHVFRRRLGLGSPQHAGRPRVLVLGGGFAGIGAARALKGVDVEVVLVDKHNYHTFQPMLYQVATDLLEATTVGSPLRGLFRKQPNVAVHQASVSGIDLDRREVRFDDMKPLTYDYLVLGLGAEVDFFGTDGASEHAFPMYTLVDALRLRAHVLERWESADRDGSLADDGELNVVVVGGGPTGVESAGALAELYRNVFSKDYPSHLQEKARIILVEATTELLAMFKPDIRTYTKQALEQRGVEIMLGELVASVEPTRVTLKSGTVLPAHTLVWGAGLQASPLADTAGVELERGKRIPVEPDLSVPGRPEVFAVGDIAWVTDAKTGEVLPQLGSVALQTGEHAGANVARRVVGEEPEPFRYVDKGSMATIGRASAVMQIRGHTLKGVFAQLAWGGVHLALLSTGQARVKTLINWTWAGLTHERAGRITIQPENVQARKR